MTSLLGDLRREANRLFGQAGFPARPPFLRRAKDHDCLLLSDAPRKLSHPSPAAELFARAGIILAEGGGLWCLDAPPAWYDQLYASLPASAPEMPANGYYLPVWSLCRMLLAHPCPLALQPMTVIRETVKAMEAGEPGVLALADNMAPRLAVLLRRKQPLPTMAGGLMAQWLLEQSQKEMVSC